VEIRKMKLKIPIKKIKKVNVEMDSMAKGKKKIAVDENMEDVIPYLRAMGYNKIFKVEKGWRDKEDIHPWLNENNIKMFFTKNVGRRNKNIGDFTRLEGKQYIVYYIMLNVPSYRMAEYIDCLIRKTNKDLLKFTNPNHPIDPPVYRFTNDKLKLLKC